MPLMKISDCEMQRIDKPAICSAFGRHIRRFVCSTEEKSSLDNASKIASFTSSKPSFVEDDEASSEFRPKMASLQSFVILEYEYEMAFSWDSATSSWWMAFFEMPLSRRKQTRLLYSTWSIPAIGNTLIFSVGFQLFLSRICFLCFCH
jgi:hypothetical protein